MVVGSELLTLAESQQTRAQDAAGFAAWEQGAIVASTLRMGTRKKRSALRMIKSMLLGTLAA